jgi:hypothetical protein
LADLCSSGSDPFHPEGSMDTQGRVEFSKVFGADFANIVLLFFVYNSYGYAKDYP